MTWPHGKAIVEALLLASQEPLSLRRISEVVGLEERDAGYLIDDLLKDYAQPGRGLWVQEVAGGYQLVTRPEYASYVEKLLAPRAQSLSHAALETLAIVAYRQPITRAEIEQVRGVTVDRPLQTLLERHMVREVGRRETPGRPILYGTTKEFLLFFGLKDLNDLPQPELPSGVPDDHLGRSMDPAG